MFTKFAEGGVETKVRQRKPFSFGSWNSHGCLAKMTKCCKPTVLEDLLFHGNLKEFFHVEVPHK